MSRRGVRGRHAAPDYTADPGKMPSCPIDRSRRSRTGRRDPVPTPDDVHRAAPRRHRSRARQRHRRARHGQGRHRSPTTARSRSPSPSPPPAARCGPRSRSDVRGPGRVAARRDQGQARLDRADRRREGRGHGQGPLERPGRRARHRDPGHHQGHHRRLGQGRRRQVVGHRQPGRRARRRGLHRRRARRRHLGLLGPPHARRRGPPRRATRPGEKKIVPQRPSRSAPGRSKSCRWASSSTTRRPR